MTLTDNKTEAIQKIFDNSSQKTQFVNLANIKRTNHILLGDATGGGHLWPGIQGKSVFPKMWSSEKIMHYISDIATDPSINWEQIGRRSISSFKKFDRFIRYQSIGIRDGQKLKVILEPFGEGIITGYPIN